jgi:hypothetical protein
MSTNPCSACRDTPCQACGQRPGYWSEARKIQYKLCADCAFLKLQEFLAIPPTLARRMEEWEREREQTRIRLKELGAQRGGVRCQVCLLVGKRWANSANDIVRSSEGHEVMVCGYCARCCKEKKPKHLAAVARIEREEAK